MTTRKHFSGAFSLVEVVLALGIAAFCLVAIFGLLPVGVNSNATSIEQTAAANVASLVMADLQSIPKLASPQGSPTPAPGPVSPRFKVPAPPVPGSTPVTHTLFLREDGSAQADTSGVAVDPDKDAVPANNPRYRATITYTAPPKNQFFLAVPTRVLITWPALADPLASPTPRNFSGSLELSSALNRN